MTIPNLDTGDTIDDPWVDAVADQLNDLPARVAAGLVVGTTNASGVLTVTHGLGWTPTAVVVSPALPNGASAGDRFTGHNVTGVGATTFAVRCIAQDDTVLASTSVTLFYVAVQM